MPRYADFFLFFISITCMLYYTFVLVTNKVLLLLVYY